MAIITVKIDVDDRVADEMNKYLITVSNGKIGFIDMMYENFEDLLRSIDKNFILKSIEVNR